MKEESLSEFNDSLKEIMPFFSYLLEEYEFKIEEKIYDPKHFGNFVITLIGDFQVRFIKDRGQIFVDVKPSIGINDWFDLRIVLEFLKQDEKISFMGTDLKELGFQLKVNYENIKTLFKSENYSILKGKLEEFRRKGAKKLFE